MTWIGLVLLLLPARPGSAEIEALSDPSREVRERAISSLATKDCPIDALVLLLHEKDARVRRGVCAVLARRGDPVAVPALLLDGSPDAAEACVRIAETCRLDLPTVALLATPQMRELLVRAHATSVDARIGRVSGSLQLSRPQIHRAHLAGGAWSEAIMLSIVRDADQPALKRAHALHVAQLMLGRALHDDLVRLLDDPQDGVRSAALTLLWRLHSMPGNRELVKRLDDGDRYRSSQVSLLISAVDQGAKPSPKAIEFLASRVAKGGVPIAADAAAVLMQYDRKRALALLTARIRTEINRSKVQPRVSLFFLRCGTPTPEILALAQRAKDPLAQLAAFPLSPKTAGMIREHLDPRPGPVEWIRIRVVSTVLARQPANWMDRARYARGVLDSDQATWRAGGLGLLSGAPAEILAPLRLRLVRALADPMESVRVKAAILLMPEPAARRVLWAALYDGDSRTAWTAGPALDFKLGRSTPVAERRRRARDALAALDRR